VTDMVWEPQGDWKWWAHDRFGLFIHWGLYALPARHEWVKNRERITDEAYQAYFDHFDPDLYDPKTWAQAAKDAGMKYFVITTKHHEGFCLWDSKYTDYKATNTPYGKDLIKPMVEAFRGEGLRVGFYHSLIDWHHPEFPVDRVHPMRDNAEYRAETAGRDVRKYAQYLNNQTRELLTGYGQIDLIFYDFSYPGEDGKGREEWQSEKLIKMTRELQPKILVDDRLDLMDVPGGWDYRTPEQVMLRKQPQVDGKPVLWETCQTFSGSWGYHRDESTWKSADQLVRMLIDTVSKGGNLLLNVGPTARGEFDQRALDRLSGMGAWMKRHGRSIYGCGPAPEGFETPQDCRLTYNPDTNRMYVHVLAWPFRALHLDGFGGKVKYAQLLNDASEIPIVPPERLAHWGVDENVLSLVLPVQKPDVVVPVIELYLK
jgi:alpha-L-fucosidase